MRAVGFKYKQLFVNDEFQGFHTNISFIFREVDFEASNVSPRFAFNEGESNGVRRIYPISGYDVRFAIFRVASCHNVAVFVNQSKYKLRGCNTIATITLSKQLLR